MLLVSVCEKEPASSTHVPCNQQVSGGVRSLGNRLGLGLGLDCQKDESSLYSCVLCSVV